MPEKHPYGAGVYFFFYSLLALIILGLIYFNLLVLVPRYLAKRKYGIYLLSIFTFCFGSALIYLLVMKYLLIHFPNIHYQSISTIMQPLSTDFSVHILLQEMQTYFFVMLMLSFVFNMAWYMRDHIRQAKVLEEIKKKQTEAELSFLKSQINPHFLFNTLNNLYGLALKKSDHAPDAILKLSSILRYLLYESNHEKIDFEKEKEVMHAYIDLEMLRISESSRLHFSIQTDRPVQIPPLLWMPVLENVFKHGTRTLKADQDVEYRFTITGDSLAIYSRNPGRSIVIGDSPNGVGGVGLDNLKKRLSLLFPGKHSIQTKLNGEEFIALVNVQLS